MQYELTYAKQKSISIRVRPDGSVHVRAPRSLSRRACDELINSKADWILKKQALLRERQKMTAAFFKDGRKTLPYLGQDYPLEYAPGKAHFDGKRFSLPESLSAEEEADAIAGLYRELLRRMILPAIDELSAAMNVSPKEIRITSARTRWGSCSGKNSLNFSWRLLAAEEDIIRYVIIHELAHTKEHNHSPRFWRIVESHCPDHLLMRQKLRTLAEKLEREKL